jgi:hypothetical protein
MFYCVTWQQVHLSFAAPISLPLSDGDTLVLGISVQGYISFDFLSSMLSEVHNVTHIRHTVSYSISDQTGHTESPSNSSS